MSKRRTSKDYVTGKANPKLIFVAVFVAVIGKYCQITKKKSVDS
jgi:hypothetical protein